MMHRIQVDDETELQVEDVGEGRPIVFIHGWPLSHELFKWQKEELSQKGYRFIGIDLRGYGKSDKPEQKYTYDVFARDVQTVIHNLELEDYYLAGFSMGGPIAIHYAVHYADRELKQLILLGPAAPSFTRRQGYDLGMEKEDVTELMEAVEEDQKAALEDFGTNFFATDVPEDVSDMLLRMGMEASVQATVSSAKELRDADLREDSGHVQVPTLIMHGKQDAICDYAFSETLRATIPDAELIPFEHSGHGLVYEEYKKVNEELLRIL
ncbi:alpha/beta fold hydrolase [Alkalicoccus urumqiensis]|uniref:Alpha/beta hydrolase n=1 Tax=Alkalicoccus urumqiensis TaxID=1548213 RepID=A0A2P6ME37_ALKUR|nr:alpha/beta hydrolase [Alkalicoccus urumqiensis]PRO64534.1 alpha/beta hydrolase [Alkalicoccus urumqiensis]